MKLFELHFIALTTQNYEQVCLDIHNHSRRFVQRCPLGQVLKASIAGVQIAVVPVRYVIISFVILDDVI